MYNPVGLDHIHRPALERYATKAFNTIIDVKITEIDTKNKYRVSHGKQELEISPSNDPESFEYRVHIDRCGIPWFNRSDAGRQSRQYAELQSYTCLISAEYPMDTRTRREFASFKDNQSFVAYHQSQKLLHAYEVIRPNTTIMLFTDHDQSGGLSDLRSHQEGVLDFVHELFKLLQLPEQAPVILTSHRTKKDGDYMSTHLRFPTVSVENCNETMKAIHHLCKHTGRTFGGLDLGTHSAYQQLRIPGCSKAGSTVKLLPADGSDLKDIGPLLVGNYAVQQIHITTDMVQDAIKRMFYCTGTCSLKPVQSLTIAADEVASITIQIRTLYHTRTGNDPSNVTYQSGRLWNVDHAEKCIHRESHKSNRMFIHVKNRAVYCQCLGRCRSEDDRPAVLLGYLPTKISTDKYPWERTPKSCYIAIQAIDIVTRLEKGISPAQLAMNLACIGDFKTLLDAYAGYDTSNEWRESTTTLAKHGTLDTPRDALKALEKHLHYVVNPHGNNKKRKRSEGEPSVPSPPLDYKFDFTKFVLEHPTPLDINVHSVSSQVIDHRFIKYEELDLSHRVTLVRSEMMTGKTSNLIIKLLQSLPPGTRIAAITPKRLFAESLMGIFKANGLTFAHYQDKNFLRDRPDCIVIELESLWRILRYNFKPYDFLLIDESESTITQTTCVATHKHQIRNNWEVLTWMLQSANKVLLTDACMSDISMGFVLDHCERKDVHYIHNIHQIPLTVNWYMHKPLLEKHLKESVARGESLFTFSGARNNAYHLNEFTTDAFGEDQSVVYSGLNSNTIQVKEELGNVNSSWRTKKAIHATPCITIGTSFDEPDVIHNVFLFPYTKTASETQTAQASRRIRNPIKRVINIAITGNGSKLTTHPDIIKRMLAKKSDALLQIEERRMTTDFDDDLKRLETIREIMNSPYEKSTLVKTYIRVTVARNRTLNNYHEEAMRIFLASGHTINIVRGTAHRDETVPRSMTADERIFHVYNGATGIMAFYEENEDDLVQKQVSQTLTPDEQCLVNIAHYIKEFNPIKWPLVGYEYWCDYRSKLAKDKRLRMLLNGNRAEASRRLHKNHRYATALAEGPDVDEHTGIMHNVLIPEVSRVDYHAYAEPLFELLDLLGISKGDFTTDSIMIKMNSARVKECLHTCRVLLGPDHPGRELPANPTYQQLHRFLADIILALMDGTFTRVSEKKVRTDTKVETTDKRTKSGKTTRSKQERVLEYEIRFNPPPNTKGVAYNALERVSLMLPLDDSTDITEI